MSRFSFAVTIIAASVILNDAFLPGIPGGRSRSFVNRSYHDSILQESNDMDAPDFNGVEIKYNFDTGPQEVAKTVEEQNAEKSAERALEGFIGNKVEIPPGGQESDDAERPTASVLGEAIVALNEANLALGDAEDTSATGPVAEGAILSVENTIAAGLTQGEEDTVESVKEKNVDEEISLAIGAATESTVGPNMIRNYVNTRQTLRDARAKNEKRLSRSNYAKEKSAEKIAATRARMEEQIMSLENDLEEKLDGMQNNFDDEMNLVKDLLISQFNIESSREEKIAALKSSLEGATERKTAEIIVEDNITAEMVVVRSKLKTGNISNQLDALIEEKGQLAKFEQAQLEDLEAFVSTTEVILEDTKNRAQTIDKAIGNLQAVAITQPEQAQYDFTELRELETMWEEAAKTSEAENRSIAILKKKFDDEFLNKLMLLGEEVPEYLKKAANDLEIQQQNTIAETRASNSILRSESSIQPANDVDAKDEKELWSILAKSLGSAAIDSAKAGVLGIRAVIDTVKEKEVSEKLKSTTSKKELDEESLKAIGDAGRNIANNVGKTESAAQAQASLKDTSNDLGSAFKALGALGKKAAGRIKDGS